MSSLQRLVITSNGTALDFISNCALQPLGLPAINNFANYIQGVTGGNEPGASFAFKVGAVQAAGLLTVSAGGSTNDETCLIANVTLTAKTSSTANNEFSISATAATQAANMAAAINASTTLAGIVTATSSLGVVTITSVVPGLLGNGLQLSESLTNCAATAFAGGTDGTAYNISLA